MKAWVRFDNPVFGWGGRFGWRVLQVLGEVADVAVGYRSCADGSVRFGARGPSRALLLGLWRCFRDASIVFNRELVGGVCGHDP